MPPSSGIVANRHEWSLSRSFDGINETSLFRTARQSGIEPDIDYPSVPSTAAPSGPPSPQLPDVDVDADGERDQTNVRADQSICTRASAGSLFRMVKFHGRLPSL